jgi:hypothetical protein
MADRIAQPESNLSAQIEIVRSYLKIAESLNDLALYDIIIKRNNLQTRQLHANRISGHYLQMINGDKSLRVAPTRRQ